jgi:hypothetical protein
VMMEEERRRGTIEGQREGYLYVGRASWLVAREWRLPEGTRRSKQKQALTKASNSLRGD